MKGKAWKNFMAKLYGFGAAIVIVGALFKIQHWPGAGIMLTIGLTTEAIIFFFSAFEPPHEDPDWSLVYPELAGMPAEDKPKEVEDKGTVSQQLDNMLEEAKVGPELIESLGAGLRSLSDSAGKMGDLTQASVATDEYVSNIKGASAKVGELSDAYSKAAESLANIDVSSEDGAAYGEQLKQISQRLSQLNSTYQLQLEGSEEFTQSQNKLYSGISELMENLSSSVEDTKRYKEEVSQLAQNLSALNTVYGNMLSAMNRPQG